MPCESRALMILVVNNNKKGNLKVIWEIIPASLNFIVAVYSAWMCVHDSVLPFPLGAQCCGEFRDQGRR